jgi:excisionase family DNA binding protein
MISDEQFVEKLRSTKMTNAEVADTLGVSLPTVRRWRAGKNLPAHAMRPAVVLLVQPAKIKFTTQYEGLNGRMPTKL